MYIVDTGCKIDTFIKHSEVVQEAFLSIYTYSYSYIHTWDTYSYIREIHTVTYIREIHTVSFWQIDLRFLGHTVQISLKVLYIVFNFYFVFILLTFLAFIQNIFGKQEFYLLYKCKYYYWNIEYWIYFINIRNK